MRRLGPLLAAMLTMTGCGASLTTAGDQSAPPDTAQIGIGFDITTVATTTTEVPLAGEAGPTSTTPSGPASPPAKEQASTHPVDAEGNEIRNATFVDTNGFHLRFTIDGTLVYDEGTTILFEMRVRNDTGAEAFFDPDARESVLVHGAGEQRAWAHPGCIPDFGDDQIDTGPTRLAPGQEITLHYQYAPDERQRRKASCWVQPGTWEAIGRFPWCPPAKVLRDPNGNPYCDDGGTQWLSAPGLVFEVR